MSAYFTLTSNLVSLTEDSFHPVVGASMQASHTDYVLYSQTSGSRRINVVTSLAGYVILTPNFQESFLILGHRAEDTMLDNSHIGKH